MWSLVVLWWLCRFRRSIGRYLDPALFDYYCNAPPFFSWVVFHLKVWGWLLFRKNQVQLTPLERS